MTSSCGVNELTFGYANASDFIALALRDGAPAKGTYCETCKLFRAEVFKVGDVAPRGSVEGKG